MRALQLYAVGKDLRVDDVPSPVAKDGEVIVDLNCAALNRRDFWIQQGLYPRLKLPIILGSDGAGVSQGKEVVINPGLDWGDSEAVQSKAFNILGMPHQGTFATQVAVPVTHVYPKPSHLSFIEAAALPLAGITAYRALLVKGKTQPGESILITGIGGGVALMAMQIALAQGLEVTVSSSSDDKLTKAMEMGASAGVNYSSEHWTEEATGHSGLFDIILDSAGGDQFSRLLKILRPGGRLVTYGGTAGKVTALSPQLIYWRQVTIQGSTMGSPADFQAMLEFVSQNKIIPVVDTVYPLERGNEALGRMRDSTQFGKIVLQLHP